MLLFNKQKIVCPTPDEYDGRVVLPPNSRVAFLKPQALFAHHATDKRAYHGAVEDTNKGTDEGANWCAEWCANWRADEGAFERADEGAVDGDG